MPKMEKKGKRKYEKPISKVYSLQTEQFLQTASVTPNGEASETSQWDTEQEHSGGTIYIGSDSNVAPSKSWGSTWEDED